MNRARQLLTLLLFCSATAFAQIGVFPPSGTGGGSSGQYSVPSAAYTAGTYYLPPGGGASPNATETSVQGRATIAGAIQNFSAKLSAAPGTGVTVTFTWRDDANGGGMPADQTVTCAISGASATSCADTTHSFNQAVNDLLAVKMVVSGGTFTGGIVLQWGTPGTSGPTGPGYTAASTSAVTIGVGSKTFTVGSGLAYAPGNTVVIASAANPANLMFGSITSYSGTSMIVNVTVAAGSGSHSDWNISLQGSPGTGNNTVCVDATGSSSTYTCPTPTPAVSTLSGLLVTFIPGTTNTGVATLNVQGFGAVPLKRSDGTTDPSAGDLVAGSAYIFVYNAGNFVEGSAVSTVTPSGSAGDVQIKNGLGGFGAAPINVNPTDGSTTTSKALSFPAPSTPTFNSGGTTTCDWAVSNACSLGAAGSPMTGSTTLAVTHPHGSGPYWIFGCQDNTGGRVVTYPGSFQASVPAFDTNPNACTLTQLFYDGSANYYSRGTTTAGLLAQGATGTPCTATPASGTLCVSLDPDGTLTVKDSSGNTYKTFKTGADANPATGAVSKINGGTVPTSAAILGTDASAKPIAATAHGVAGPRNCNDTSGSGTAQSCSTTPTFTPGAGDEIIYQTTTQNTGDVTVAVNGAAAAHVRKWQGASVLAAGDLKANVPTPMTFDGTFWEISTIGNAPAGSGVSSITAGCGLSGGTISSSGTIADTAAVTYKTADYTIVAGDMCLSIIMNSSAAHTFTLPQAGTTGFEAGKFLRLGSIGTGAATVSTTTSTFIAGGYSGSSLVLNQNDMVLLVSDPNGNWMDALNPRGGSGTPCTTTSLSLQFNNGGAFGCVTEWTYSGGAIVGSSAAKLDLATNGGQFKYAPAAPSFSTTDAICAATGGSPACPTGGQNAGTTEYVFAQSFPMLSGTPAAGRAVRVNYYFSVGSTGSPTATFKLKACPTANYTSGAGSDASRCSAGEVTLWTSAAAAPASTATNIAAASAYTFAIQGVDSTHLEVYVVVAGRVSSNLTSYPGTQVSTSTVQSGAYTVYLTLTWSAATAGNWYQLDEMIPEYIY